MKALEKRKEKKAKKPKFSRQDAHKKHGLASSWRKPRGRQSKMRLNKRGYSKSPSLGYGTPKELKGLHKTGLLPKVVSSKRELDILDKKIEGAILTSGIGEKKRMELITYAYEKNIKILNADESSLTKLKKRFDDRKKRRAEWHASKTKKSEKKTEKKVEKKAGEEKSKKPLEEAIEDKSSTSLAKEKEKILTKKE